jgi:hypothetical protein
MSWACTFAAAAAGIAKNSGRVAGRRRENTSRLTAKIDNNAIVDSFQLYLHAFVLTSVGEWAVVQQGLSEQLGWARRYHWHSATVRDFTSEPHSAIEGQPVGTIMNLVDRAAGTAQRAMIDIVRQDLDVTISDLKLCMPAHHDVRSTDVDLKRLGAVLAVAHERDLRDFSSLLLVEKLGPRTLQSLALVAEVVQGAPVRFSDPARFSFAHGGKDGHPFPVPLKTYDESISVLQKALDKAKLGDTDRLDGMRRLDQFVRAVEDRHAPQSNLEAAIRHERAHSPEYGGRTVMDDRKPRKQLSLF